MKKIILISCALGALMVSPAAFADIWTSPFVGVKGAYGKLINNPDIFDAQTGKKFVGSVQAGIDLQDCAMDDFAFSLEYSYRPVVRKKDVDDANVKFKSQTLMFKAEYTAPMTQYVNPFISVGAGISRNSRTVDRISIVDRAQKTADQFAYEVGGGLKAPDVIQNTDVLVGYRYIDGGTMKTGRTDVDFRASEVYIGLNYRF